MYVIICQTKLSYIKGMNCTWWRETVCIILKTALAELLSFISCCLVELPTLCISIFIQYNNHWLKWISQ